MTRKKKEQPSKTTPDSNNAVNVSSLNRIALFWRISAALLSAALLSLAFPPFDWDLFAWVALVPLIVMPTPRRLWERALVGFLFGYLFFALTLHWLNEVGFGAGYLLSLYCALFPMFWYMLASALYWHFKDAGTASFPGSGPLFVRQELQLLLAELVMACTWVALEWLRGQLFTGFPWNNLGVSQHARLSVIQLASYTGCHGVSFVVILCNLVLGSELSRQLRQLIVPTKRMFPWHLVPVPLAILAVCISGCQAERTPPVGTPVIRMLAIQANLPQCREWSKQECMNAINVYRTLSIKGVKDFPDADIILWPESAVPASLGYQPYMDARLDMAHTLNKPMLIGALANHEPRNPSRDGYEPKFFNSAFQFDKKGEILDYYDKVHRVPFGEYTPFGDRLPWLCEMIGMGRDLYPGRDFHVFTLPKGALAGVNICFEDTFPGISRQFVRNGANMLITITNDSWYNRSCGAQQHANNMVFRAVENRRPFMRVGNNSHTYFVTPNGRCLGQIKDPTNDSPFYRGYQAYDVPVMDWGTSFYTQYGDLFSYCCGAITLASVIFLFASCFTLKRKQLTSIKPQA